MATYYSDVGTVQNTPTFGNRSDIILNSPLRMATAVITLNSSAAVNDLINIVKLPRGSIVLPQLSYLHYTGYTAGSAPTMGLSIGDTELADEDSYMATHSVHDSTANIWSASNNPAAMSSPYEFQSDAWVQGKIKSLASSITQDATLLAIVVYVKNK